MTDERWKPPFMPWFEQDFSGSFNVRKQKPLARLMYRSLLQEGWHSDRPPYLPNVEADLQLMADAPSAEAWAENRESILALLTRTEDGQWLFHPKAVREYDRAYSEHLRKRAAGSKRWGARSELEPSRSSATAEHEPPSSTAHAELQQPDRAPLSSHNQNYSHSTTKKEKSARSAAEVSENHVEQLYQLYPVKVGKTAAKQAIRKAIAEVMRGDPDHPAMILGDALEYLAGRLRLYATCVRGVDEQFIPNPATWLHQGRFWDDERNWRARENSGKKPTGAFHHDGDDAKYAKRADYVFHNGG